MSWKKFDRIESIVSSLDRVCSTESNYFSPLASRGDLAFETREPSLKAFDRDRDIDAVPVYPRNTRACTLQQEPTSLNQFHLHGCLFQVFIIHRGSSK